MASFLDTLKQGLSTAFEVTKRGAFALAKAINRNRGKVYAGSAAAMLVADCIAMPPSIMQIPGKIAISAVTSTVPAGLFYIASYITEKKMSVEKDQAAFEYRHIEKETGQSVTIGEAKAHSRRNKASIN